MSIKQNNSAPVSENSLPRLRETVLNRVYIIFLIIGVIVLGVTSIDPITNGNWILLIGYLITYFIILLAYKLKTLPYIFRALIVLLGLIVIGVSELWYFGFGSSGYLFLFSAIILSCWFIGPYLGIILLSVSSVLTGFIIISNMYENLSIGTFQRQFANELKEYLMPYLGFFVISVVFISLFKILITGLQKNILAIVKYQEDLEYSHTELQNSVSMFNTVIESFPSVFYMYDLQTKHLVKYNENHWKMTGYSESEIKAMTIYDWLANDAARLKMKDILMTIKNYDSVSIELPFITKDGSIRPVLFTAKSFTYQKKDYFLGFSMDLTETKELESKFKQVFDYSKAGIMIINKDGEIKEQNAVTSELAKVENGSFIGKTIYDFSPESDRERRIQMNADLFEGRIDQIHEERESILPDGTRMYLDVSVGLIPFSKEGPRAVYVLVDISEQKKYQLQLELSLKEKGLLLQEVHHRVRNNLQIISSLINISSSFSKNIEDFKQSLALRIQAMSLMHERLSEEEGFASVDLESYIYDLIGSIYELYEIDINKIQISLNIPEKIVFKIDIASSLGILINEIISNSLLHAFIGIDKGQIVVDIHKIKDHIKMNIKDDGIGLPDGYSEKDSFGVLMIDSLVQQLEGEIVSNSGFLPENRGTEFILTIPCM